MSGSFQKPARLRGAAGAAAANSSGTPRCVPLTNASVLPSGGSMDRHTGTKSVVLRAMSAMVDQSKSTPAVWSLELFGLML